MSSDFVDLAPKLFGKLLWGNQMPFSLLSSGDTQMKRNQESPAANMESGAKALCLVDLLLTTTMRIRVFVKFALSS